MKFVKEITNYYAKSGRSGEVLAQRIKVTRIRAQLGLPLGTIFRRLDGEGPDVRWECDFSSLEEYNRDRAARETSAAFVEARQHMHSLLEKFERHIEVKVDGAENPA